VVVLDEAVEEGEGEDDVTVFELPVAAVAVEDAAGLDGVAV